MSDENNNDEVAFMTFEFCCQRFGTLNVVANAGMNPDIPLSKLITESAMEDFVANNTINFGVALIVYDSFDHCTELAGPNNGHIELIKGFNRLKKAEVKQFDTKCLSAAIYESLQNLDCSPLAEDIIKIHPSVFLSK